MNYEFHFYINYILAKDAGFTESDCAKIAYSSQWVDHNNIGLILNKGTDDEYRNLISQTIDIFKPKKKLTRIYFSFHFVPGNPNSDTARRKDGKLSILNTTPGSDNATKLMDEALLSGNPYRIGIASHCYADSWAHQNFIGYFDSMNAMKGDLLAKITPNSGHADARHKPDIPGLTWEDPRLIVRNRKISNKERFLEAAKHMFKKYHQYLKPNADNDSINSRWRILEEKLDVAIGKESSKANQKKWMKKRVKKYKELLGDFTPYNRFAWIDEAIETTGDNLPDLHNGTLIGAMASFKSKYRTKDGFENSNWFKFQEAVKAHQSFAEDLYKPIFHDLGIDNY